MLRGLKRGLKSRQPGMVEICINVSGSAATPAASGQDAMFVLSVVDNGAGNWTINFKESALLALIPKGLVAITEGAVLNVEAVTVSSITINSEDGAGAQLDADFALCLNFASQVPYYF